MRIQLWVVNETKAYFPAIKSGVQLESSRAGSPASLKFTYLDDGRAKIQEGNAVKFLVNGTQIFFGFIFTMDRKQNNEVTATAYDQIRYLKNKDSYIYTNKRADELIQMIAGDFALNCGTLENTGFIIAKRSEDNQTLMDIIQNALDITLMNTGILYCLYDDNGSLTLKNVENMLLNLLIDQETAQTYSFSSSINTETYNQIKLVYENDAGQREVYMTKDSSKINEWGVLQYYEKIDTNVGAPAKADALLNLYNAKTRSLKISGAFGDIRVRGGTSVVVRLKIGDTIINNLMLVEKVTHKFNHGLHTMDLTLRGGDIQSG